MTLRALKLAVLAALVQVVGAGTAWSDCLPIEAGPDHGPFFASSLAQGEWQRYPPDFAEAYRKRLNVSKAWVPLWRGKLSLYGVREFQNYTRSDLELLRAANRGSVEAQAVLALLHKVKWGARDFPRYEDALPFAPVAELRMAAKLGSKFAIKAIGWIDAQEDPGALEQERMEIARSLFGDDIAEGVPIRCARRTSSTTSGGPPSSRIANS